MTSQTTSPEANVELVRAGFEAFNAGDVGECMAHMAPDFIINLAELPEPQHGREIGAPASSRSRCAAPGPGEG